MDQDARADFEQQLDNERRRVEEETSHYRAANLLWDKCRNHPARAALDPHAYDKQFCAECIDARQRNYVEREPLPASDYRIVGNDLYYAGNYAGPMKKEHK